MFPPNMMVIVFCTCGKAMHITTHHLTMHLTIIHVPMGSVARLREHASVQRIIVVSLYSWSRRTARAASGVPRVKRMNRIARPWHDILMADQLVDIQINPSVTRIRRPVCGMRNGGCRTPPRCGALATPRRLPPAETWDLGGSVRRRWAIADPPSRHHIGPASALRFNHYYMRVHHYPYRHALARRPPRKVRPFVS